MIRHKRKITKKRGTRTCGKGNTKNKRGKGSRMGRGSVKRGQRNKLHIIKYEPERLYKKGFHSLKKKPKAINLKELEKLVKEGSLEVDVTKHGYEKVLGAGTISKPLAIKAHYFTEKAKEKIEKAGGKAFLIGEES